MDSEMVILKQLLTGGCKEIILLSNYNIGEESVRKNTLAVQVASVAETGSWIDFHKNYFQKKGAYSNYG